jgi:hypothetical protein
MRIAVEPVLDVLPARWSELCQMACYDLRDPLIEEISTGKSACGQEIRRPKFHAAFSFDNPIPL